MSKRGGENRIQTRVQKIPLFFLSLSFPPPPLFFLFSFSPFSFFFFFLSSPYSLTSLSGQFSLPQLYSSLLRSASLECWWETSSSEGEKGRKKQGEREREEERGGRECQKSDGTSSSSCCDTFTSRHFLSSPSFSLSLPLSSSLSLSLFLYLFLSPSFPSTCPIKIDRVGRQKRRIGGRKWWGWRCLWEQFTKLFLSSLSHYFSLSLLSTFLSLSFTFSSHFFFNFSLTSVSLLDTFQSPHKLVLSNVSSSSLVTLFFLTSLLSFSFVLSLSSSFSFFLSY